MNGFVELITIFKKIFICGFSLFLFIACAGHYMHSEGHDAKDSAKITRDSATLKPSGMYEKCFELKQQQKLLYNFDSDRPVNFNVHFHVENEVHYPVQQNGVTQHDGMIDSDDKSFQVNTLKHYCLMWENPEKNPVNLSYECIVEKK